MNKRKFLALLLCLVLVLVSGCANKAQPIGSSDVKPPSIGEIGQQSSSNIEKAKNEVIEKYKNERDVLGTGKFIEDTYKKYPDDEIISTIYFYDTAKSCYEYHNDLGSKDTEWLNEAKAYASKISPDYKGEFSNEIIPFVSELLGNDWQKVQQETAKQEEKYNALSLEDKKEIKNYIQNRYNYYAEKEGTSPNDKHSNEIWVETSQKYGLSEANISIIWFDYTIPVSIAEYEPGSKSESQTTSKEPQKIVDSNGKQIWKIYISSGKLHFTGTYKGTGNFIVQLSDSNQDLIKVIANEIGDYVSDKVVSVPYKGWYYLEVYGSDGSWEFNWK